VQRGFRRWGGGEWPIDRKPAFSPFLLKKSLILLLNALRYD